LNYSAKNQSKRVKNVTTASLWQMYLNNFSGYILHWVALAANAACLSLIGMIDDD